MHSIYFFFYNASNSFVCAQKLAHCNAYCAVRALLFTSHRLILFRKSSIIPVPLPPRTFISAVHCLTFFFCSSTVIFTIPLTLRYKWLYTEPFCGGEMYASM